MTRKLQMMLMVAALSVSTEIGLADPIGDARAAISEKKYEQVDKLLEQALSQRDVPEDVLRVSLEAAIQSGRPVTAERRISALLKRLKDQDLTLLYTGARLAEEAGDQRAALSRYLSFVRQKNEKSPEFEHAMVYVLKREAYSDEYRKFLQLYGPSERAWEFGQMLLNRLLDIPDAPRALEVAELLMQQFAPTPAAITWVQERLWTASNAFQLGREPAERFLRPLQLASKYVPTNWVYLNAFMNAGGAIVNDETRARIVVDQMTRSTTPLDGFIGNFGHARNIPDENVRLELGKAYLAQEGKYNQSVATYEPYLRQLVDSPQVFAIAGKVLVSPQDAANRFDAFRTMLGAQGARSVGFIDATSANFMNPADPAAKAVRVAFMTKHVDLLTAGQMGSLMDLVENQNIDALVAQNFQGKSFRYQREFNSQFFQRYNLVANKAALTAGATDFLYSTPWALNWQHFYHNFIASPVLTPDEKLAAVDAFVTKAGTSQPMRDLFNHMARVDDPGKWTENAAFVELKKKIDAETDAADPVLKRYRAIFALGENPASGNPQAQEIAAAFLNEYKGKIPWTADAATSWDELNAGNIWLRHWNNVRDNAAAVFAMADLWAPRLDVAPAPGWGLLEATVRRVREVGGGPSGALAKLFPIWTGKLAADNPGSSEGWAEFANIANLPADQLIASMAPYYPKMKVAAVAQLFAQRDTTFLQNRQQLVDEFAKILVNVTFTEMGTPSQLVHHFYYWTSATLKVPVAALKPPADFILAEYERTNQPDPTTVALIFGTYVRNGFAPEAQAVMVRFQEMLKKQSPTGQWFLLNGFLRHGVLPTEPAATLEPGMRYHALVNWVKPIVDAVPESDWDRFQLSGDNLQAAVSGIARYQADPPTQKAMRDLSLRLVAMHAAGSTVDGPAGWVTPATRMAMDDALARQDLPAAAKFAMLTGANVGRDGDWDTWWRDWINPISTQLDTAGLSEAAFGYLAAVDRNRPSENVQKQMAIARSRVATKIPNMIPVAANDPSFPLYEAAAAYSVGNEGLAWEKTFPSLPRLTEVWESLEINYVAWSIDQMRKQKLNQKALDFSMNVLLRETEFDPEVAARISLTKGDIYRDMANFQAARIEYEGLRNNSRFNRTAAGMQATYRLVHLLITTKDYESAEGMLERMVDSDEVAVQAEAYYLYAKMAYQRAEYVEAKDHLQKVKDRVVKHVEAALLEGELKLKLPGQLANPDVRNIGDERLATVVVPGRTLVLQLKDQNLSVARGGASIPVIVTTSKGADKESVKLLPSSSDKNLFEAEINTGLGQAVQGNLVLEVGGEDIVSYEIDPEFQKANDLTYPAKLLDVRSEARLVASSGEILTQEEEEKRQMERQLRRNRAFESRQLDVGRDGRTIRPGSPIYVQVTDFDRDISNAPEVIFVELRTSSGDVLTDFELTETGLHTGTFRAQVPTAVPLPKAAASDTDESRSPAGLAGPINLSKPGAWSSLADGQKPKWFGVDTMTSNEVAKIVAEIPNLGQLRELSLLGSLAADDFEELASYPARDESVKGGMQVEIVYDQRGEQPDQIGKFIRLAGALPAQQESTIFSRNNTDFKDRDGWMSVRMRGAFYLPQNRSLELKFLQAVSPNNWQHAFVFIDGQMVLGGNINEQTIGITKKVDVAKGAHRLEVYLRDHSRISSIDIGYRKDDGTFESLPGDWFNIEKVPELAEYLKPKGKIEINGDTLTATLAEPRRLRNVRLQFRDFTGTNVAVKSLTLSDSAGKAIIPVPEDFTMGTGNRVLEISPGDEIVVAYQDTKRLKDEAPTQQANLNSSFYNASVSLANEVITENERRERRVTYFPAKRTRVGDQLLVVVSDFDADTTDERDTVDVNVTTSAGEKLTLQCLETQANYNEEWHKHAGVFVGILRMGKESGKDTIKVADGDKINVTYLDKENTIPGVPVDREYSIFEAGISKPDITVYRTDITQVEDTSDEAKAKARRLMSKSRRTDVKIFKDLVVASHPDYRESAQPATQPSAGEQIAVSVSAPLLFEVSYPKMALNSGSIFNISAIPESELKLAEKENRKPNALKVPTYLYNLEWLSQIKGYPLQLRTNVRRDNNEMLNDGVFSGVIRFQVGKPGDPIDDLVLTGEKQFVSQEMRDTEAGSFFYRVPTLIVSGSDTVRLRVENEAGEIISESKVKLLSNARLELLDSAYIAQNNQIHLGERFHVRVTDADQDATDERDKVSVDVVSSTGDALTITLEETLAHSGVFTGNVKPEFVGEKVNDQIPKANPADDKLQVYFGDTVGFSYNDPTSLLSAGPVDVKTEGKIYFGSDGELAVFSKQFKDPDIAVKTRFLMAEALFEMAKEYRKLNQKPQADESISRGKMILEEALRDYPDTTYAVQGEYLLANLAQELNNHQEAIGRYSHVISGWPDSEYASESQFKKAVCFEKMQNYDQACEEYVRLTYVYPESPLVADATVRLGNYYYKKQSYAVAGKVFFNFRQRNPGHKLAPDALFLAAQCAYKQQEWGQAAKLFQLTVDEYPEEKDIRSEAMYWLGDSFTKSSQFQAAYQTFKKLTWDYPDSKFAKIARGRLTEEAFGNMEE